jgi:hypothetical protein
MRAPCLLCLAFAVAQPAQAANDERGLDPALLALCGSSDAAARRYCLEAIDRSGDTHDDARRILAEIAANDPLLHEDAERIYQRLHGAAPARYIPATPAAPVGVRPQPPPDAARRAGDPMRVVYAPTAFTRPEGTWSFNAFQLGTLTLDRGVSPNVALGLQTALPIGALVIGPTLRVGFPFEGGAFGFHASAILIAPFVGNLNSLVVGGGGPILTLGDYDRYVNLGALMYFASTSGVGAFAPHAGFSIRSSEHSRFGAEIYLPSLTSGGDAGVGKIAVVLWGLRFFGESFWGDIALADPFCSGCSDLYKNLPLGIPFLNFGVGL